MPAHQVLPYKAVSARLRPFTFSQSTPIGLDRVGRRRQMRASNGEFFRPTLFRGPFLETAVESSVGLFSVKQMCPFEWAPLHCLWAQLLFSWE